MQRLEPVSNQRQSGKEEIKDRVPVADSPWVSVLLHLGAGQQKRQPSLFPGCSGTFAEPAKAGEAQREFGHSLLLCVPCRTCPSPRGPELESGGTKERNIIFVVTYVL